jgi:hypothetical protein
MFGMRRRSSSPFSAALLTTRRQFEMQSDQLKRREFITLLGMNDLTRGGSDENAA